MLYEIVSLEENAKVVKKIEDILPGVCRSSRISLTITYMLSQPF